MADRYWVGGAGTWNTTSTTNWSASSGGASGASVPTAADSVFFDQAGTYTVTLTGALTCLDFTVSAGTVTFSSTGTPTISGSMSLIAGTVWSATGAITFNASAAGKTITTNGTAFTGAFNASSVTFNGTGSWTLGSACSITNGNLVLTQGTFNTGNYALNIGGSLVSNGTTTRALSLGSSTVTIGATASSININFVSTLFTFSPGTSQINVQQIAPQINGGGMTFYNIAFTGVGTTGTININGANTFNNFAVTAPNSPNYRIVQFNGPQIINGTLSTTGTAGNRRVAFTSIGLHELTQLTVNSAPSLVDADFRDVYVNGTAAPISGTRIGNRGNCFGITFSTPKTVYMNTAGSAAWNADIWAATSGGVVSTDYYPLPQDTAVIDNSSGPAASTISLPGVFMSGVDMSTRTLGINLQTTNPVICYGNWTNGSGTTVTNGNGLTFAGGGTQIITSAGKAMTTSAGFIVDSLGGTVKLADALTIGSSTPLSIQNGTFDTQGYTLNIGYITSSSYAQRAIYLRNSTVNINYFTFANFGVSKNLTFDAGTSSVIGTFAISGNSSYSLGNVVFYDLTLKNSSNYYAYFVDFGGARNFTLQNTGTTSVFGLGIYNDFTLTGTLTLAGGAPTGRVALWATGATANLTAGYVTRTITANAFVGTNCDIRDITLAGAAAGSSTTRGGDCGGNTGIVFPAPKTVYWNLAGTVSWYNTGWATSSGGAPAVNNFPLAQDTIIFDNTNATLNMAVGAQYAIGTLDMSARTLAMTFTTGGQNSVDVYGNVTFGTGVTGSGTINSIPMTFRQRGTVYLTTNGVTLNFGIAVFNTLGTVILNSALNAGYSTTQPGLIVYAGNFNANNYNVTLTGFYGSTGNTGGSAATDGVITMGSGTWTITGYGNVWYLSSAYTTIRPGTATIIFSDTTTNARTMTTSNFYYSKIVIGGATGTSTFTFSGSVNTGELASTKTVAHTVALGTSVCRFGKWSISGTAGNVVTVTGGTNNYIYGPAVTGIDYLALGTVGFVYNSPGEFYAGANSTGTGAAPLYRTAAPAPRTLYWVGGTGNWSDTAHWSTSSGGAGGVAVPTSLDSVIFDSASNATAYTVTVNTTAWCNAFTMSGPAAGNVTFTCVSGGYYLSIHGNFLLAATGVAFNTGSLNLQLAGNSTGLSFTTNGVSTSVQSIYFTGIGAKWTLGSSFFGVYPGIYVTAGGFDTGGYSVTWAGINSYPSNGALPRVISLQNSSINCAYGQLYLNDGNSFDRTGTLAFSAGTSSITLGSPANVSTQGETLYNVTMNISNGALLKGGSTFNNLTLGNRTGIGEATFTVQNSVTVTNTLTLGTGSGVQYRMNMVGGPNIGTAVTITAGSVAAGASYIDFRDITISSASAPISGTSFGDCGNNTGITFPAAKTVYRRSAGGGWGDSNSWSLTNGGAGTDAAFPLPQDTAVFPATPTPYPSSGGTCQMVYSYCFGTVDLSARTAGVPMTLALAGNGFTINGDWIGGSGATITATGSLTFIGRNVQNLTTAGITMPMQIFVRSVGGSVVLGSAFTNSFGTQAIWHDDGTFNSNGYNVTLTAASASFSLYSASGRTRGFNFGAGSTWTIASQGSAIYLSGAGLTVSGTGTLAFTSANAKTLTLGGTDLSSITINHAGAGTLTFGDSNSRIGNMSMTYAGGPTTISFTGGVYNYFANWTAKGSAGKILTISSSGGYSSPGYLYYTGVGGIGTLDYLYIDSMRGSPSTLTWYGGTNSTYVNAGWIPQYYAGPTTYAVYITESSTAVDSVASNSNMVYDSAVTDSATGVDSVLAAALFRSSIADTTNASQTFAATQRFVSSVSNTANATDTTAARATFGSAVSNTANATDTTASRATFGSAVSNTANATDTTASRATFGSAVSNTANATDSIASKEVFRSSIADTVTASQTNGATASFLSAVSNTANATDTTASRATFGSSVSNTANATDTTASRATFGSAVSNTANATDSIAASETLRPAISEQANASQTNSAAQRFVSAVSNTANASQTNSATAVFNGAVTATVNVSDSPSAKEVFGSSVSNTITVTNTTAAAQRFGTSVSEQATASQTNAAREILYPAISEQVTASQTNAAAQAFNSNVATQATAHDAISTSAMFAGYVTETATGSETDSAKAVFGSAVDNSITIDATNAAQAIFRTNIADTVQVSDQSAAAGALRGYITETSTAHDVDAVAASTFNAAATATATASQTNAAKAAFGAAVSNTANASDSDVGRIRFPGNISESATALDSIAAAQRFRTAITEANQASNIFAAIETFKSTVSNTVRASQTAASQATFGSAVANAATAAQTNSAKATFGAAFDGSANASDSDVGFISFPGAVTEAAQVSEQDAAQAVFTPQVADGAAASEFVATNFQVNAAATATAQASETAATSQVANSAVAETATANSTAATRAIFQGIISEAVQGSDRFDTTAVFLAAFSEFAQAYAADVGYLAGARAVTESSTASATNAAVGALRGYISESATGDSTNSALFFHATYINESAAGTDSVDAAGSTYNAAVTNTVQAVDAVTAGAIFYAAVMAYAGITDVATARYLWELIDDRQTPDWGTINDTQSAGWVEVNDIQAASWQNVGNTQADGWTQIDDTQDPNWGRITP